MSDFKAKMHQNQFRLRLRPYPAGMGSAQTQLGRAPPRPHWRAFSDPPNP